MWFQVLHIPQVIVDKSYAIGQYHLSIQIDENWDIMSTFVVESKAFCNVTLTLS